MTGNIPWKNLNLKSTTSQRKEAVQSLKKFFVHVVHGTTSPTSVASLVSTT